MLLELYLFVMQHLNPLNPVQNKKKVPKSLQTKHLLFVFQFILLALFVLVCNI